MRISAIDEANKLYNKLRTGVSSAASKVGSFIQKNPVPAAYASQQFQQRVAQPIAQRVSNTPIVPFIPQVTPKSYVQGQVVNPIRQGVQQMQQKGGMNKILGAGQVVGGALSATPQGALWNVGQGFASGIGQSIRERTNPQKTIAQGINKPTSFAGTGLGIQNPYVAMGVDLLSPSVASKGKSIVSARKIFAETEQLTQSARAAAEKIRVMREAGTAESALKPLQKNLDSMLERLQTMRSKPKNAMNIVGKKPDVTKGRLYDVKPSTGGDIKVYHGTNSDIKQFREPTFNLETQDTSSAFGKGIYTTDNPEYAKQFGQKVKEINISKDAKFFDLKDTKYRLSENEAKSINSAIKQLGIDKTLQTAEGYSSVRKGDLATVIFDDFRRNLNSGEITELMQKAGYDGVKYQEIPLTTAFGNNPKKWGNKTDYVIFSEKLANKGLPNSGGEIGGVTAKPQTNKGLETPLVENQPPQGNSGSSSKIIPQVDNPTDPFFNVNRLNVKPEIKQAVKTAVEQSKPEIEKVVGKTLTNKEAIDLSNRTAKVLHNAVPRQQTLEWEAAMLKSRQILADEAQNGTVTPEFLDALMTVKSQGTDIARKLQSLSIGADAQTVTAKQVMLEAVLKQTDKVDEVLKAANGVDFNDFQKASEFYRKFIAPTREEWIDTLRYNAMLSSPNTHFNNIFSNIQGTGIVAPIEKTLTGTFDWMRSTVTGKDRKYLAGEGVEYAKGYYSNLGNAAKRFGDVMKGKVMGEYPELRDIPLSAGGKGKFKEAALKLPQRLLEAADQFFTTLTSEGSKRSLEYRASKGVKVTDIAGKAGKEAEKRLFRAGFGQADEGPLLRSIEFIPEKIMEAKASTNPVIRATAKLSFPFVRIAVNLFKQGLEYSPAGVATIPGAKEKLPQFTKAFMGTMVGLGAAMLASSDRITWAKPTSEKQRGLWDKGGMQEYSVKIGDKWVSYSKLHPVLAFNLATVAGVKQALDNQKIDDGTAETMLTSLGNVMRFYADQSYVKNIGDFISATEQGASGMPKLAANYAQQFVPYRAFMGWLARTLDPVQRTATPDAGVLQKQMEYFFMQIPGLRQTLPEKTDIEGNPIENKNRFINAVSPAKVSTSNPDYENAYRIQKNIPKIQEAKKQALELYIGGDKEKALELKKTHGFTIKPEDIKRATTTQKNKATELYVEGKIDQAKELKKQYNLTISQTDIVKAAKKKSIELYKLGLKDQAKELKTKYGFTISSKDLE